MEPCFTSEILVGAFHVSLSGVSFAGNASFLGDKCWSTWKPSLGLLGPKQIPGFVSPHGEVGALGFGSLQLFMEAFNIQDFRLCLNSSKCLCCKGRSHLLLRGVAVACGKNHLLGSAEFPSLSGLPGTISHFPGECCPNSSSPHKTLFWPAALC